MAVGAAQSNQEFERELEPIWNGRRRNSAENGLSPEEHATRPSENLANSTLIGEEIHSMNHSEVLGVLSHDVRQSLRVFRKSPGGTALSMLSIALGIGLTAGMFSVGDAILLRPMPFHRPAELLSATSQGDDGRRFFYGFPDYLDMAAAAHELADLAAYQQRGSTLTTGGETEHVLADSVTPNYFSLLGVRALLGEASVDARAGQPQVVLG